MPQETNDPRVIAIFCRTDDAFLEAERLRDSGRDVIIGLRDGLGYNEKLWDAWKQKNFKVYNLWEAVCFAEIIQVW